MVRKSSELEEKDWNLTWIHNAPDFASFYQFRLGSIIFSSWRWISNRHKNTVNSEANVEETPLKCHDSQIYPHQCEHGLQSTDVRATGPHSSTLPPPSLSSFNVSRPGRLRERALLSLFCRLYHRAAGGLNAAYTTSIRPCWGAERLRADGLCVCVCVLL